MGQSETETIFFKLAASNVKYLKKGMVHDYEKLHAPFL